MKKGDVVKMEAGKVIAQKFKMASDKSRVEAVVQYVYDGGKGLIIKDRETGKEQFILTEGRDIQIIE